MKTLTEYAEERHLTYEAIRRQVMRHEEELKGHIETKKDGKRAVRYLDEEGEAILNRIRGDNAMVNVQAGKSRELEDLRKENEILKDNIRELQATVIKDHEKYMDLQTKYIGLLEGPKSDPKADRGCQGGDVKTEGTEQAQEGPQKAPGTPDERQTDNSTPSAQEAPQGPQKATGSTDESQKSAVDPSTMTFGQKLKFLFGK